MNIVSEKMCCLRLCVLIKFLLQEYLKARQHPSSLSSLPQVWLSLASPNLAHIVERSICHQAAKLWKYIRVIVKMRQTRIVIYFHYWVIRKHENQTQKGQRKRYTPNTFTLVILQSRCIFIYNGISKNIAMIYLTSISKCIDQFRVL